MFFSRKGFFFQDDEIYGFHVLTIFNCKWGSMRISLWDEILDLQARSTQPVPGTIILIKFIFVKDSIQCFLCTSCARLQRPRLHSSICVLHLSTRLDRGYNSDRSCPIFDTFSSPEWNCERRKIHLDWRSIRENDIVSLE